MSAKEVIPFAWKLVGYSYGTAVTLFKAVERDDVEVQLLRVQRDGYYKDLKVLDINTKIVQPATASGTPGKKAPAHKAAKPAAKKAVVKKPSAKKRVTQSTAKAAKTPATKKKKKAATKVTKKKKRPAKDTPKRKAKAR